MKKIKSRKDSGSDINNLCVKTYMEILGYGCIVSARGYAVFPSPFSPKERLYVDHDTNKFRLGSGRLTGGVLDLASQLFKVRRSQILSDIVPYCIDQLMSKCGDRQGAIW